eukprot:jgi/Mesen1/6768/ME000346S05944
MSSAACVAPQEQRRDDLQARFNFWCKCERCLEPQEGAPDAFLSAAGRCGASACSCPGWLVPLANPPLATGDDDALDGCDGPLAASLYCNMCRSVRGSAPAQARVDALERQLESAEELLTRGDDAEGCCHLLEHALLEAAQGAATGTDGCDNLISHYPKDAPCCQVSDDLGREGLRCRLDCDTPGGTMVMWQGVHPWHHMCLQAYTVLATCHRIIGSQPPQSLGQYNGDDMAAGASEKGPGEAQEHAQAAAAYQLLLACMAQHTVACGETGGIVPARRYWLDAAAAVRQVAQINCDGIYEPLEGRQASRWEPALVAMRVLSQQKRCAPTSAAGASGPRQMSTGDEARKAEEIATLLWPLLLKNASSVLSMLPSPLSARWHSMFTFNPSSR